MSNLLALIQKEQNRVAEIIAVTDPTTGEYKQALDNLSALCYLESHKIVAEGACAPCDCTKPEPEPEHAPEPAEPAEPAEPIPDISHVRERLAELKQKGVSIKELLGEFNAQNLSGVSSADYNALLRRAEELAEATS